MPTTNLGLPTITGNMTADVVRDVNALAESIDNKVGIPNGLAKLGPNGKLLPGQENTVEIKDATTTQKGITQLSDDTNSTSTILAATANSVKKAWDLAIGKYSKPVGGIPKTDLIVAVQTSLGKADGSVQESVRNVANGFAGLDGAGKLLESAMPTSTPKIVEVTFTGDGTNNRYIDCGFVPKFAIGETQYSGTKRFFFGWQGTQSINGASVTSWGSKLSGTGVILVSGANGPNDTYVQKITFIG